MQLQSTNFRIDGAIPNGFKYILWERRFNTGCALASPMTFANGESRMQFGYDGRKTINLCSSVEIFENHLNTHLYFHTNKYIMKFHRQIRQLMSAI